MQKRMLISLVLSLLFVTSLFMAACGSPSSLENKLDSASLPTPRLMLPLGTYTTRLSREDNPELPSYSDKLGQWELKLINGTIFSASLDGNVVVEGQFYTTSDKIFFTDQRGIYACLEPWNQESRGYSWDFNEQTLSLRANNDTCDWHRLVLTSIPLIWEDILN